MGNQRRGVKLPLLNQPQNLPAVAAIYPAADKSETVLKGLNAFVDMQKQNFEMYLADQYEIASNARVETLEDGTILMVMCEGQDDVFTAIKTAVEAGK